MKIIIDNFAKGYICGYYEIYFIPNEHNHLTFTDGVLAGAADRTDGKEPKFTVIMRTSDS